MLYNSLSSVLNQQVGLRRSTFIVIVDNLSINSKSELFPMRTV